MLLNVNQVTKEFQQASTTIHAVKEISFSMQEQETLAITGTSGSGKTTLLSLLAGLEQPTKGSIEIIGNKITSMSEKELSAFRSQNVGIIFQQFHLMPHLTAEENVGLPLEIHQQESSKDISKKVHEALTSVGLQDRYNHLPHKLSGGERQRVAIARASIVKPKILLADEPSGNLDTATGTKVMDLLFSLVQNHGMTMILVTHDMNLAKRCQRQINLN